MLARCLNSIASQLNASSEVIVVDNASQDNSRDVVKNIFPWTELIANECNLGFAHANNQALKICRGTYVYFLNPDTEVRTGALRTMIEFMDSYPEVGLAGTRIVNPDGSSQSSVERRYPGEKHTKHELKGLKGDIAWVLGASMIVRRSILNDIGGFDERFFLYGEDLDLCLAIRKAGWSIGFISDAEVVHWGGQSERNTLPIEIWRKKFDAELVFYNKHYSPRAIRAIKRENVTQAHWRIFTLRLTLPFCKDKEALRKKLNKYRLALQIFRN
jgi:GT2 family glycosyltransferase